MTSDRKQTLLDFSKPFLASRHPMLLLRVPGCVLMALNSRNLDFDFLTFKGAESLVVRSRVEYAQALEQESASNPKSGGRRLLKVASEVLHRIRCYCGQVAAILALRTSDCVYETAFAQYQAYGDSLQFVPGWEFVLDRSESTPEHRSYHILRAFCQAFPSAEGGCILAVRLVPSAELRLMVTGSLTAGSIAGSISFAGTPTGAPLMKLQPRVIDRDQLRQYSTLEKHLRNSLADPARINDDLNAAAEAIYRETGEKYPIQEVLDSICEDRDIESGIRMMAGRLWDVPVLAAAARRQLDSLIAGDSLLASELPLHQRADLAQLQLPFSYHQAADTIWPAA